MRIGQFKKWRLPTYHLTYRDRSIKSSNLLSSKYKYAQKKTIQIPSCRHAAAATICLPLASSRVWCLLLPQPQPPLIKCYRSNTAELEPSTSPEPKRASISLPPIYPQPWPACGPDASGAGRIWPAGRPMPTSDVDGRGQSPYQQEYPREHL